MKRLRHPIRAIREPFGTAGLIVAMIALVAALGGTALAATKLNSTQKKEVEKIAKKYAGAPGAAGATGPTGANGKEGPAGEPGANGKNGTNGRSVEVGTATTGSGGECGEGGVTVQVAGEPSTKKHVCNGSPWTAGGTLPSGQTETGTFATVIVENPFTHSGLGRAAIPFAVPLAHAIEDVECGNNAPTCHVHYVNQSGEEATTYSGVSESWSYTATPLHCLGNFEAPKAPEGELCIYANHSGFETEPEQEIAEQSKAGAILVLSHGLPGFGFTGSWAVQSK